MTSSQLNPLPPEIACPICRHRMLKRASPTVIRCENCAREFSQRNRFVDLVVGERFPDAMPQEELEYEDLSHRATAEAYWLPLFQRLLQSDVSPTILSLGCGTGADIDVLNAAGLNCLGIDNGNRTELWKIRQFDHRLLLANGCFMPFENDAFSLIYCGCVFPHVGVDGDSDRVNADYAQIRAELAGEMVRVLRPGGHILCASPNRRCPVDVFHQRPSGSYFPRLNSPFDPFLLSASDYQEMFATHDCELSAVLPNKNYWHFIRSRESWRGRALGNIMALVFSAVSSSMFAWLRRTPVNPWLVMQFRKS